MAKLTDKQRKKIIAESVNGSSIRALAAKYGVSTTTIQRVLKSDTTLTQKVAQKKAENKAYGHCSTKKIWKSENDGQYEINIGAEFLNRPSANTAATMCHEMVHLYCLVNEIQDTCQKGRYHNKTFKAEAEVRDLEIGYDRTVGFSHTNPTEAFKKTLEDNGFVLEVPFARVMPEEKSLTATFARSAGRKLRRPPTSASFAVSVRSLWRGLIKRTPEQPVSRPKFSEGKSKGP